MKSKRKHKHKEKRYYLSARRAYNDLVRYSRKIYEMIKAFRELTIALAGINPF